VGVAASEELSIWEVVCVVSNTLVSELIWALLTVFSLLEVDLVLVLIEVQHQLERVFFDHLESLTQRSHDITDSICFHKELVIGFLDLLPQLALDLLREHLAHDLGHLAPPESLACLFPHRRPQERLRILLGFL